MNAPKPVSTKNSENALNAFFRFHPVPFSSSYNRPLTKFTAMSIMIAIIKSLIGAKKPKSVENTITIISLSRSITISPSLSLAAKRLSPVLAKSLFYMYHGVLSAGILALAIEHCFSLTS